MFGTSVNSDHDSDCKAARQDCLLKKYKQTRKKQNKITHKETSPHYGYKNRKAAPKQAQTPQLFESINLKL